MFLSFLATMLVIVSHGESHRMTLGLFRKVINLKLCPTPRRLVLANISPVFVIEVRSANELGGGVDLDLRCRGGSPLTAARVGGESWCRP